MPTPDFIINMRKKIGHDALWLPGVKVVLIHENEVLLVRRADNGRWTLPAGILEPGEEPAIAAVREVFEETAVNCAITALVGVATTDEAIYPNGDRAQYLDIILAARYLGGEALVNDDENLEVGWFDLSVLPALPPKHQRAINWAVEPRAGGHFITAETLGTNL
ncbi:NUDIX hydrolase [Paeniglutamicibacter terrestris]|uniref:NUDIX domain-containing protein n=1 Tax=Paeniglutamicibacter terrestris TaxID=2723403 RepID=A0ABX1G7B3_9MICC|nr:NUDIX domain-containing protein [Paeniglutamicibacter terrestris]ASN40240.1 DNA mismatch repair protein MutT [Arthrobacter sp. 7749]NKG21425.1 NUDIX domain-containing protein [Paeniglutamicibacter terrestris]